MSGLHPELRPKFLELAQIRCLPFLQQHALFSPFEGELAYVVVGSVASGLCSNDSDIDMAIVGEEDTFGAMAKSPNWNGGAGEAIVEVPGTKGIPLRYQATSYDRIEAGLRELKDHYFYHYMHSVALADPKERYVKFKTTLGEALPQLRKQRLEGKLDWLRRRYSSLEAALRYRDVMNAADICLEMVSLAVKVTALLDNVPFNPRRRLLLTGLAGRVGYRVEDDIHELIGLMGELQWLRAEADPRQLRFPVRVAEVINLLSAEARKQGFETDLDRPDPRCAEYY